MKQSIKSTISFDLIKEEAIRLSVKLNQTIYIIYRPSLGNGFGSLVNSLTKKEGVISAYNIGKEIEY